MAVLVPFVLSLALAEAQEPPLTCGGLTPTIVGTDQGEVLVGSIADDIILGLGGDDTIKGREGNDTICGGDGNDRIYGEKGDDEIHGDAGNDVVYGGPGQDTIFGEDGDDRLRGEGDDDELDGGAGNDTLIGGDGEDALSGGDGADRLYGQDDDDVILGQAGDDVVYGGEGEDTISGDDGDDRLRGEGGNDNIDGGAGLDTLIGGDGNDTLLGGPDRDRLHGRDGDDTLEGQDGDDNLDGEGGNDKLFGGGGDDDLDGGDGLDNCDGGPGTNVESNCETVAVEILSPENLSLFNAQPITVSGTQLNAATLDVNGIAAAVGGDAWTAEVPLAEGNNTITAVAQNAVGHVATDSIQVTLDTTPPTVTIDSPPDGFVTHIPSITVAGMANDIVVGTVNGDEAAVVVRSEPAGASVEGDVANRSYLAPDVPLVLGDNTITAVVTDKAGNTASTSIVVTFEESVGRRFIGLVSGNNPTGLIGTQLLDPLVVELTDEDGNPVPGQNVIFKVVEANGTLSTDSTPGDRSIAVLSGADGRAQANWTLGTRSGAGNNAVETTALGFEGLWIFTATAISASADKINVDGGNNQTGVVSEPLPNPFVAVVTDAGHNRLHNVPVTFTVVDGGGDFGGQPSTTVNTDTDGRAQAVLTLGPDEGFDNNIVEADFPGNPGFPAKFLASAFRAGDPADTSVSGVVLDNQDIPIRGVTLHIEGTSLTTLSDQQGQFTLQPAPVGHVLLLADGSTADRPGVWPTLEFDLTTVAGQDNTIGMPIYLLPLDIPNALFVDEVTGGVLTLPDLPGFSLTIAPGSATFPGGGKSGLVSVTLVHSDKIPMVPSFGQQPRFIVTIQPAGVLFDPVAPITIPNVEGLAPGEVTEMYSFDHDLGQFVSIGTGTVSDDGTTIESDPGVGILKGGWHCGGNPQSSGSSATLSLTVSPTKVVALVDDTFTITANGNPPLDGVYGWQITGGDTDAVEFTSISACPNQPSCQATLKAKKGGKTTVRVTFTCTTTGQSVSEDVEVIVLEADLDIEGVADADEESKGGIVGLNDDDDNTNSTPDKDESGTVAGENDLKKINLKVAPTNIMGTVKLEATAGGSKIKVWESATKGTQVTLPKTWTDPAQVPQMLWVEGFDTSGSVRDVGLKLSFTAEGKTADDKVKLTVVRIDLVIHKAKVIDTGESEIPEADELTKGAQTWVNLDNDDKDTKFDTGTTDTSVAGEDEMSKLKLKVFPKDVDMGVVKLEAFAGAADIKAWKMATKGTEYTFGSALNVPADFVVEGDALVKDLWGEGIEAHTAQQATKLRMTYDKTPGLKDEAALTFIGVKAMMWIGRGNGFTAGSTAHNSNTLDQDPAFGAGSNRLFAGGRAADVGTALDNADLEVELTVAPIENLDLYLKSYDVDDPSTETTRVDPNDGGAGGTYSGTAIGYTADEDNRGDVGGDKAGQFTGQDADDIVKVTYTPADTKKKAEFETAHHPGDNYKTVANGDKDFLKQLRNRDKDDGFRIVDPNVSGAAATREVRDPTMYSSQVLGVWRLLHVENDSMVAVPAAGAQRNQADGNITAIAGTAALAQRVTLSVSLAAGLPSGADGSPHLDSGGNGRFEGGTITIGGTPTANLDGNGANYARRNAGISIPFTVRAPAGPGLPADATGNTVGLAGTTFTLNVTGGALAAGHTGGTITVAGVVMNITAVNPGANTVTVAALANIPFVLIDDDTFVLPNNSNVGGLAAFNAASVLHVNDGGGGANNDQTVPFDLNGPNTSAGEVAIYNANRGSSGNEQNTFWVVYVASAYQDQETSDLDADREGGFTGSASPFNTTHNTNLVVGADGALIWREAEADTATNPFFVATNHQRNTAHEVGHQFGLGHGQVGLMHATLSDGNNLKPVSVNLVRSRVRSPGE